MVSYISLLVYIAQHAQSINLNQIIKILTKSTRNSGTLNCSTNPIAESFYNVKYGLSIITSNVGKREAHNEGGNDQDNDQDINFLKET